MKRSNLLATLALVLSLTPFARSADWPAASAVKAPALPDTPESLTQGLTLTLEAGGSKDTRDARLVSLFLTPAQPPSPFLKPSTQLKATWTGNLTTRIRDTISLSAVGSGKIHVTLNDQPALETLDGHPGPPTKINKGKNKLVVEYTGPQAGGADLRLFWQSDSYQPEPIPPTSFSHDTAQPELRTQSRLRAARELVAEERCLRCHTPPSDLDKSAMPELSMDAPNLSDVGARLNPAWLAAWIADPKSQRPQATMPKLLHGPTAQADAADIAAYLATLGKPTTTPPAPDDAAVTAGARTYLTLGCIACHTPPDAEKPDPDRLPHAHVRAKYQPAALVAFLKKPESHYAWTRMPNFRLSDEEANNLAAYLIAKGPEPKSDAPSGDAAKGQKAFTSAGCLNCHTAPGTNEAKAPALADLTKSDWTKGCLAKDDAARAKAPDFSFTDDQRAALQSLAATGFNSLQQDTPAEIANRQYTLLNCAACHTRDGSGDKWSSLDEIKTLEAALPPQEDKGEHFSPDQSRPLLTWFGEKLKPDWAAKFIAGQMPYKPRPWLRARMPGFPAHANLLANGLASDHGYSSDPVKEPAPNPELSSIGQHLAGKEGGFSCIQCHAVANQPAGAAFEAPGVNFATVKDRLRHDYYTRWVRNPLRIDRSTRMPTFTQPDGKTAVKDVLDGDAPKQFEALWNYLLTAPNIQPPTN